MNLKDNLFPFLLVLAWILGIYYIAQKVSLPDNTVMHNEGLTCNCFCPINTNK